MYTQKALKSHETVLYSRLQSRTFSRHARTIYNWENKQSDISELHENGCFLSPVTHFKVVTLEVAINKACVLT